MKQYREKGRDMFDKLCFYKQSEALKTLAKNFLDMSIRHEINHTVCGPLDTCIMEGIRDMLLEEQFLFPKSFWDRPNE